ncbi:MAG: ribonuclease P protein component [Chlamydiae bacterium]|nr:ribonuclease P protein component [Chlamydiota bacterium]
MRKSLSQQERLKKRREFQRLQKEGRKLVGKWICLEFAPSSLSRLGITASSRYGNSPERNSFKRRAREMFRLNRSFLKGNLDINVIPRLSAKTASFHEIQEEFRHLLSCAKIH